MSTTFFVKSKPCECCGRNGQEIRMGVSAAGWYFCIYTYEELGLNSLDDWCKFWEGKVIADEYGKEIDQDDMMKRIVMRGDPDATISDKPNTIHKSATWEDFYEVNNCTHGRNGLLRPIGRECGDFGYGTYYYAEGWCD